MKMRVVKGHSHFLCLDSGVGIVYLLRVCGNKFSLTWRMDN